MTRNPSESEGTPASHPLPAERSVIDADGVEFRRVDSGEIDDAIRQEMVALYAEVFSHWPALDPGVPPIDYLRWKTSNPYTAIASIQAVADGRIVLTSTAWASWVRIDRQRRLRIALIDLAIPPAYQGRRIFSRSVAHRTRIAGTGYDLSFHERGATDRNQSPLKRYKGHSAVANSPTRRYRVLRPFALTRALERSALAPGALAMSVLGSVTAAARRLASPLRGRGLTPRDETVFDHRFDALFEEAATEFDVICERSASFLRWRYGDRRAGPFIVRSIADGDRLLGYAVLRPFGERAFIADLLALPGRDDVVEALLDDAVAIARRRGIAGIECWLTRGHPYRRALRRQGFFDSRVPVVLEFHPVGASAADLERLRDPRARLHFLHGDTDLV